ncbi:hypothetical protein [Mesorhizobium abyssinicae]|uniref:hypothetical protein n=1 Tax=Mesorhizobium abyssinicae TaxID=1209958 RepID=UPI003CF93B11
MHDEIELAIIETKFTPYSAKLVGNRNRFAADRIVALYETLRRTMPVAGAARAEALRAPIYSFAIPSAKDRVPRANAGREKFRAVRSLRAP